MIDGMVKRVVLAFFSMVAINQIFPSGIGKYAFAHSINWRQM
jgi:hypothetical protein